MVNLPEDENINETDVQEGDVVSDSDSSSVVDNSDVENAVGGAVSETVASSNPSTNSKYKLEWYVVQSAANLEFKAKQALEERIKLKGLQEMFGEIHIPQESVVELVKGQKKTVNKKFFPGYILVQMHLNEDTWHLVKETPRISGFLGDSLSPLPMTEEEVARILTQVEEGAASPKSRMTFEQGETVKVTDGPFAEFNGTVEEVKPDKGKLRVLISIFGRPTPVELDFFQVEKLI